MTFEEALERLRKAEERARARRREEQAKDTEDSGYRQFAGIQKDFKKSSCTFLAAAKLAAAHPSAFFIVVVSVIRLLKRTAELCTATTFSPRNNIQKDFYFLANKVEVLQQLQGSQRTSRL